MYEEVEETKGADYRNIQAMIMRTSIVTELDWWGSLAWVFLVRRIIWSTSTLRGLSTTPRTALWKFSPITHSYF